MLLQQSSLYGYKKMTIPSKGFIEGSFPDELKEALQSVAAELGDVVDDIGAVELTRLTGAFTNEVYQINWPTKNGDPSQKILLRVYGDGIEVFFNRDNEIRTFEYMSRHGHGPRLLCRFPNGRLEEFIHARTLSAADLRKHETAVLVAAKLREFHNLDMPGPRNVLLWNRIRDWIRVAKSICSPRDAEEFRLCVIKEEVNMLEKQLSQDHQEIGFCHNDLQYGNLMLDEETRTITIIDYEFAGYNPVAYDIANHFCEMTSDYHYGIPHIPDYSKYPGV
uniref:Choline kinase 1 n=1 Tax=Rhizophora mucronata TaxID=61149 RepID=A0A2P2MR36_RHIMU